MNNYIDNVLNNPLSKLFNEYTKLSDEMKITVIKSSNNNLLLLHGIMLMPEDIILYIISFLFNNMTYIKLYYKEYSLYDALTLYNHVLLHNVESMFVLPFKEYDLIINSKHANYITFENYECINNIDYIDDDIKNIIGESYILPPVTFINTNIKFFILINVIVCFILGSILTSLLVMHSKLSTNIIIIVTISMIVLFLLICCGSSYGVLNDIFAKTIKMKNFYESNNII